MARTAPLDTHVDGDLSIQTDSKQALRIRAIGTDSGTTITPSISGNDVGPIVTEVGDIHPRDNAEQGLLQLGDLYYYIPPDTRFELDGSSSDTVRLQGQRIDGISDQFMNSSDETRFNEQGEYHWTFEEGAVDVSEQISDTQTFTIHTVSPASDEKITMAGIMSVSQSSDGSFSVSEKEIDIFFELDGQRIPGQFNQDDAFLIDITNMPRPPTDTTDQLAFEWGSYDPDPNPLVVMGDQDLDIKGRNTSGGALGNANDTSTFTFTGAVVFDERR